MPKHEVEFERAKAQAFETGVTDKAQFKGVPENRGGGRNKRNLASDDQAMDSFRKRMRKY